MKIKLHHVLITFFLAVLSPAGILAVKGQDASYPIPESYDAEADKEREKVMYSPGEADQLLNSKIQVSVPKDSTQSRTRVVRSQPEAPKNSSKPSSQEDDSILSFNFLYYLFEKYKMQDIVDQ